MDPSPILPTTGRTASNVTAEPAPDPSDHLVRGTTRARRPLTFDSICPTDYAAHSGQPVHRRPRVTRHGLAAPCGPSRASGASDRRPLRRYFVGWAEDPGIGGSCRRWPAAISAGIVLIEVPVTRRCEQIAVFDRCEGEASDGTLAALVVAVEDVDGGSVVRCDRGEELRG